MNTLPEKWIAPSSQGCSDVVNPAYVEALESYAKKAAQAIVALKCIFDSGESLHPKGECESCDKLHVIVLESQKILKELK